MYTKKLFLHEIIEIEEERIYLPCDIGAYKLYIYLVSVFYSNPEVTLGFLSLSIALQW